MLNKDEQAIHDGRNADMIAALHTRTHQDSEKGKLYKQGKLTYAQLQDAYNADDHVYDETLKKIGAKYDAELKECYASQESEYLEGLLAKAKEYGVDVHTFTIKRLNSLMEGKSAGITAHYWNMRNNQHATKEEADAWSDRALEVTNNESVVLTSILAAKAELVAREEAKA